MREIRFVVERVITVPRQHAAIDGYACRGSKHYPARVILDWESWLRLLHSPHK